MLLPPTFEWRTCLALDSEEQKFLMQSELEKLQAQLLACTEEESLPTSGPYSPFHQQISSSAGDSPSAVAAARPPSHFSLLVNPNPEP